MKKFHLVVVGISVLSATLSFAESDCNVTTYLKKRTDVRKKNKDVSSDHVETASVKNPIETIRTTTEVDCISAAKNILKNSNTAYAASEFFVYQVEYSFESDKGKLTGFLHSFPPTTDAKRKKVLLAPDANCFLTVVYKSVVNGTEKFESSAPKPVTTPEVEDCGLFARPVLDEAIAHEDTAKPQPVRVRYEFISDTLNAHGHAE